MKLLFGVIFAIIGLALFAAVLPAGSANALGLKVAPLEYKTTLKENERQQGFIDISNPSGQSVKVRMSVQGFKQIDDSGALQFFNDASLASAIKTDLAEVELGPREALRMTFTINGGLLPESDVYAAIFFTTDPVQPTNGVGQSVRVGTLLSIVNKTPGPRSAKVTALSLPPLQLSDTVNGSYAIKNIGSASIGFYPVVTVSAWPGGKAKQVESSLVFGGRERTNDFTYDAGIGIHLIEIKYGDSTKSQWVITLAPWMLIAMLLVAVIVGTELLLLKRRRATRRKNTVSK